MSRSLTTASLVVLTATVVAVTVGRIDVPDYQGQWGNVPESRQKLATIAYLQLAGDSEVLDDVSDEDELLALAALACRGEPTGLAPEPARRIRELATLAFCPGNGPGPPGAWF